MAKVRDLRRAIIDGKEDRARQLARELLHSGIRPRRIFDQGLVAAMTEIGKEFGSKYYVPEALVAARAFDAAMRVLNPAVLATGVNPLGSVVIGTVKGDLHDVGKNLIGMILQGANFRVADLGIDVDKARFAERARHLLDIEGETNVVVGMSALLTTTMRYMTEVINELEKEGLRERVKVIVGGAPVTEQYAQEIGADAYAQGASDVVPVLRRLVGLPADQLRWTRATSRAKPQRAAPWYASPMSLAGLVARKRLENCARDYARTAKVAADILSAPDEQVWAVAQRDWRGLIKGTSRGTRVPADLSTQAIRRHQETGIKRSSRFCQIVQRSALGRVRCWLCALFNSFDCYRARRVTQDTCHMGLVELRAPILIGNYLAAVMSGGQVWAPMATRKLRRVYEELGPSDLGVSFEEFQEARGDTYRLDHDELEAASWLLEQMASSLSLTATSEATERMADQISLQTGYRTDMRTGLTLFLLRVAQLLRYSRATVWLRDPFEKAILRIGGAAWDTTLTRLERRTTGLRDIPVGKGLVGWVVDQGGDLLLSSRSEIKQRTEYADTAKFLIGIRSYLAVPIKVGVDTIGAIEMGIEERGAYHADDLHVLRALASTVGHYVRACREFGALTELLRAAGRGEFVKEAVSKLPGLVQGRGCSVFLRGEPGQGPAFLAATTGLVGVERTDLVHYEPGEGATGWVLQHGEPMNLGAHADMGARREDVFRKFSGCRLQGKHREDVRSDPARPPTDDELASAPFLVVPILHEDTQVLGVIRLTGRTRGNFSMEDQNTVEACAKLIAMSHASQSAALHRKRAEIEALRAVDQLMIRGGDLSKILRSICERIIRLLPDVHVSIYVLDDSERVLHLNAQAGRPRAEVRGEIPWAVFERLASRVGAEQHPGRAESPTVPPQSARPPWWAPRYLRGPDVLIPLVFEDRDVGLFWAKARHDEQPSQEDRLLMEGFAAKAAAAIQFWRDRSQLHKALETTRSQLAQWARIAHLGTFAAGLAHEIRNPLNTISWTVDELGELDLPKGIRRALRVVDRNAARIEDIVDGILKFARQDLGEVRGVLVSAPIREILRFLRRQIDKARIRVIDSSGQAPEVRGNPGLLRQVFLNLILNGVQAMSPEGGTLRIVGQRAGSQAEILVSDTGPGVPPEARARIFDPFFTTRGPRGGVGLGLSVSYGIVRQHGGDIRVLDDPEWGATFSVTLPVFTRRES